MNLIAAVDGNWGIGLNNRLLYRIEWDVSNFKSLTLGNIVVMGRKTFDSLPNGALPGRLNIVLTRHQAKIEGAVTVGSISELSEYLKADDSGRLVYVIGGGEVYSLLIPHCSRAYITKTERNFAHDTHLENLDLSKDWHMVNKSNNIDEFYGKYVYCEYVSKKANNLLSMG